MVSFIFDQLQQVYRKLLQMIVKNPTVDKAVGSLSLMKIAFDKDTLLPVCAIQLSTSSLAVLYQAKPNDLAKKSIK